MKSFLHAVYKETIATTIRKVFGPLAANQETGALFVELTAGSPAQQLGQQPNADDKAVTVFSLPTVSFPYSYDEFGNNWDRYRGTTDRTLLASAVRNASNNSADFINFNHKGGFFFFDVTAVPGAVTVTLNVQGKDPTSGTYFTILSSAAIVAVSFTVLRVFPALTAVATLTANDILPRIYRVTVTHSGAGDFTYSVGNSLVL